MQLMMKPPSTLLPLLRNRNTFHRSKIPRKQRPLTVAHHFSSTSSTSKNPNPSSLSAGEKSYRVRNELPPPPMSMPTLLAHAGLHENDARGSNSPDRYNEPLSPPLELASTYERPPSGDYNQEGGVSRGLVYSRAQNPTRELLERAVAKMEVLPGKNSKRVITHEDIPISAAFSSGMAAVSAIFLAYPDSIVLLPDDCYHGVNTQLITVLEQHGIRSEAVDMTDHDLVERRVVFHSDTRRNVILWLETPSNPLTKVTDIRELSDITHRIRSGMSADKCQVTIVVDSTWAPPPITQPLLLGADAVLHSATKYFGGHSDLLLGILSCSPHSAEGKSLANSVKTIQTNIGAVASPFDCWLTLRGLRTLDVRLRRQCSNALQIATFLEKHDLVDRTHYPGLRSHPQYEVASLQMKHGMFGGMLSFEVESEEMAMAVAGAVRIVKRGTSLGGTETLIEHRASIEPEERRTSPPGLLRVSVGLEDVDDLIGDFDVALSVAKETLQQE